MAVSAVSMPLVARIAVSTFVLEKGATLETYASHHRSMCGKGALTALKSKTPGVSFTDLNTN